MLINRFKTVPALEKLEASDVLADQLVAQAWRHSIETGEKIVAADNPMSALIGFAAVSADFQWQAAVSRLRENLDQENNPLHDAFMTAPGRRNIARRINKGTLHELIDPEPEDDMRSVIAEMYPEAVFVDGYDEAIIGVSQSTGYCVIYDLHRCAEILVERDGMSHEEALEYLDYNVLSAYSGPHAPIFIEPWGYA